MDGVAGRMQQQMDVFKKGSVEEDGLNVPAPTHLLTGIISDDQCLHYHSAAVLHQASDQWCGASGRKTKLSCCT